MLEDTFEESKLSFPKCNSQCHKWTGICQNTTNICCCSIRSPKNSINSYKTDASLADAVKYQAGWTKLSEVTHISCCSLRVLSSGKNRQHQPYHNGKGFKTVTLDSASEDLAFLLWQAGISQVNVGSQRHNCVRERTAKTYHLPQFGISEGHQMFDKVLYPLWLQECSGVYKKRSIF